MTREERRVMRRMEWARKKKIKNNQKNNIDCSQVKIYVKKSYIEEKLSGITLPEWLIPVEGL